MFNFMYHRSVLLNESIEALNIYPSGVYIDGTFGLGGHSKLILSNLTKWGQLIAVDRDWNSIQIGKLIVKQDRRFTIIHTPFSKMIRYIKAMNLIGCINGILLDLGVSTSQLSDPNRGFSFIQDGPLDMRMDTSSGQSAAQWLATASQKKIEWVLKNFGEEKFSKRIAKFIVSRRQLQPILSSLELSKIIRNAIPYNNYKYKKYKHPATRSFLAIRMYINEELKEITQILQDSLVLLSPRGRLVVISFNSLEDRIVKHFIYQYSRAVLALPKLPLTETQILNMYPNIHKLKNIGKIVPSFQEIKQNIRARSAILRCAEKTNKL